MIQPFNFFFGKYGLLNGTQKKAKLLFQKFDLFVLHLRFFYSAVNRCGQNVPTIASS